MNNARRKEIAAAIKLTNEAFRLFTDAKAAAGAAREAVEAIRDDEQEYFDNMPEGLQGGDKGQVAEAAISQLEEAFSVLEEAENFEADLEGAVQFLEEAAQA